MVKYDSYKDSGVEWIGEVPSHWLSIPLKYFLEQNKESIRTGPFGSTLKSEDMVDNGVRIYNQRTVYDEDFSSGEKFVTLEKFQTMKGFIVENGDILVSSRGTIGKMTIVPNGSDIGVLHPCLIRLRIDTNKINKRFLWWYMNHSSLFLESVKIESNSTTIDVIYSNVLSEIRFPIPSIQEQQQIVKFFDTKITLVDSLIEKTQRKIELLKEQRTSLINHVVTKGLNPNVELKDSGVEWIGEIPNGWNKSKIKFLSQTISKGTTPSTVGGMILDEGPIFYIKMSDFGQNTVNIPNNFIDFDTNELLKRSSLNEYDILFVITGEIGRTVIVTKEVIPSNINQNISFIRLKKIEKVKFTWYWLSSEILKSHLKTLYNVSTLPSLSMEDIGNLHLPQPPINEQQQIVEYLDKQTQIMDTTITKEQKRIELLKEYRQSLISNVVTGKLKVTKDE